MCFELNEFEFNQGEFLWGKQMKNFSYLCIFYVKLIRVHVRYGTLTLKGKADQIY